MKKLLLVLAVSGIVFFANDTYASRIDASVDNSVDNSGNNRGNTTDNSNTNVHVGDRNIDRSTNAEGGAGGKGGRGGNATASGGQGGAGGSVGDTTSTSSATGGSVGDTTSTSSATGGSIGDTSSESTIGDTTSQSNNDNRSTVGNTTSESNNANESKGGDVEFNYTNIDAENVASSAASVITGFCQSGGSAQSTKGGFSLAGNDLFCDRIRMADYYWVQYERQVQLSVTFQCHKPSTALKSRCAKVAKRLVTSLDKAWDNTEQANDLLDSGEFSSKVEKAVGPFARIGGILGMLFLL